MAKFTLTTAQRFLLGIIACVESGVTSPEDAVDELKELKAKSAQAGILFKADYTLADFEKLREIYVSSYVASETEFDESTSY